MLMKKKKTQRSHKRVHELLPYGTLILHLLFFLPLFIKYFLLLPKILH